MNRQSKIRGLAVLLFTATAATFVAVSSALVPQSDRAYGALGFSPMSAAQIEAAIDEVLPVYLLVLYAAFDRPDEASTYDTLASVAEGDALEAVYLARVGAPARAGLQATAQKIHQIDLLSTDVSRKGDTLSVLAIWQVVGTVSHAEHTHVRGGTFGAAITLAPVKGTWKITDFVLGESGENLAALRPD